MRTWTTFRRSTPTSTSPRRSWLKSASDEARAFWDRAARRNAEWYVATSGGKNREEFFRGGARDADGLLAFCGIPARRTHRLLEIGCGIGRMTQRFADLFGEVVALDVSPEMIARAEANLAGKDNVSFVLGSGSDLNGLADASFDAVFSYITLQHIADRDAVLRYVAEAGRVLRDGGRGGLQVRRPGWRGVLIGSMAQAAHTLRGRATMAAAYRGTRVPAPDLVAAALAKATSVELRPRGARHLWVILQK